MLQNRHSSAPGAVGPSWVAGLLWCAAALSAGYWFWQWPVPSTTSGTSIRLVQGGTSAPTSAQLPRALGGGVATTSLETDAGRIQLVGVIASMSGQGSALIAMDGQPPKPYRVGQAVGEGLVLQSLSPKRAQLGATLHGPGQIELQLPADKTP